MLDVVTQAVTALQAETATYPHGVQLWMKLMGVSFLASILFVHAKTGARWILAALVLNLLGLVVGKMAFPEASRTVIGTCVHLLFWPAILLAVWRPARFKANFERSGGAFGRVYVAWLVWASLLMSISLVLDVRTFASMWA